MMSQDIAVILFTYLWPSNLEVDNTPFEKVENIKVDNDVYCYKLKDVPIIGVCIIKLDEKNISFNSKLVKKMKEYFKNLCYKNFFLALHDRHFGGPCIERDIQIYEFEFMDDSIKKAILFQHTDNSYFYRECLEPYVSNDNWQNLDAGKFYKSILDYILKKPNLERIYLARAELMTPFVPFHLFWQLGSKNQKEWEEILKNAREKIKDIYVRDKFKNFLQLCNKNEDEISEIINNCKEYEELKVYFQKINNDFECNPTDKIERLAKLLESIIEGVEKNTGN